jgi:hypothetical protein
MKRCDNVSIEDGQRWLRDAQISERGMDSNNLRNIECAIVYFSEKYNNRMISHSEDLLEDVAQYSTVLTQKRGGELIIEMGSFEDSKLEELLSFGLELPEVPPQTIYLTENAEKECLAVSICDDHVMRDLKNGPVELTATTVEDLYPLRAVSGEDIVDVLDFLEKVGACRYDGDVYIFDRQNQRDIFRVKEIVRNQRVDEYLGDSEEEQKSLGEF